MPKTLTGAAKYARRRRELIDTARDDMTTGHPDTIVALLVQAEKARPTRNPEPLRPEIREAVNTDWDRLVEGIHALSLEDHDDPWARPEGIPDPWAPTMRFLAALDDDTSHAAEERRYAGAMYDLAGDPRAEL